MDIDTLIKKAIFSDDQRERTQARELIQSTAREKNIELSSLFPLYKAMGTREIEKSFTVPAINIRTLTFDTARIAFRLMEKNNIGPVIFEIAKSEMGYTNQRPSEYAASILAAAIKENYHGPIFIQGDHFQVNKEGFEKNREEELQGIETLIKESIAAGFLNIDIDASTLVDLSLDSVDKQQKINAEITAHFTSFIRSHELTKTTIAIGGEIGHIGGVNSTSEDFRSFMNQYISLIQQEGMGKVSVQTGSSHGGIPLPDGTIKQVSLDFSVLRQIGQIAKKQYGLAGAVQHGASTLSIELFSQFPQNNTAEIHLATGFQNIVYDKMPEELRETMYEYTNTHFRNEKKSSQTDQQFLYSLRKKTLGPFKKQLWELRNEEKQPILNALEEQFETIFEKLGIHNTDALIKRYYGKPD